MDKCPFLHREARPASPAGPTNKERKAQSERDKAKHQAEVEAQAKADAKAAKAAKRKQGGVFVIARGSPAADTVPEEGSPLNK